MTWRARSPRPIAVFCWHTGHAARLMDEQWRTLEDVKPEELSELRQRGLL